MVTLNTAAFVTNFSTVNYNIFFFIPGVFFLPVAAVGGGGAEDRGRGVVHESDAAALLGPHPRGLPRRQDGGHDVVEVKTPEKVEQPALGSFT